MISFLTDEVNNKIGKIVLYIPMEALQFSPEEAKNDLALVQRLESKSKEDFLFPRGSVECF